MQPRAPAHSDAVDLLRALIDTDTRAYLPAKEQLHSFYSFVFLLSVICVITVFVFNPPNPVSESGCHRVDFRWDLRKVRAKG